MGARLVKQIFYGFIYFAFWGGLAFWAWQAFLAPPAPTCSDKIQNQNEEGVDCGFVCGRECPLTPESLAVRTSGVLLSDDGLWDAFAVVENQNIQHGAALVPYIFTLKDTAGTVIARREGNAYAMPAGRRWVIAHALDTGGVPAQSVTFSIEEDKMRWRELTEYQESELIVEQPLLRFLGSGTEYAEATGIVTNRSPFDYDAVDVAVVVSDAAGKPVAVRTTQIRTLRSRERRAFRVSWRRPFLKEAVNVKMEAYTNLLVDENYMRRYGRPERFQQVR